MNLFDENIKESTQNLLSRDGVVNYFRVIFSNEELDYFFKSLLDKIEWKNDEVNLFGKKIITRRKVAWYGDHPFKYTYSKSTKNALIWSSDLLNLKKIVENHTSETYNSCLLNLYHNGSEGMAWHSDNEVELKRNGAIASLSFGASRRFLFKHKNTKEKIEVNLENGSLLLMKESTQQFWLHSLPITKKIIGPRINLTFRTILQ